MRKMYEKIRLQCLEQANSFAYRLYIIYDVMDIDFANDEINQICALGGHALDGPKRLFSGLKTTTVTKGIRGDVQDSHHRGAVIWRHAAAAALATW